MECDSVDDSYSFQKVDVNIKNRYNVVRGQCFRSAFTKSPNFFISK